MAAENKKRPATPYDWGRLSKHRADLQRAKTAVAKGYADQAKAQMEIDRWFRTYSTETRRGNDGRDG